MLQNKVFLVNSGKIKVGYITDDGDEIITVILTKDKFLVRKPY